MQTLRMIKNKIIFKTYLKILKKKVKNILGFQTDFCSTKHQRTIFKNCFSELFLKTSTKYALSNLMKINLFENISKIKQV